MNIKKSAWHDALNLTQNELEKLLLKENQQAFFSLLYRKTVAAFKRYNTQEKNAVTKSLLALQGYIASSITLTVEGQRDLEKMILLLKVRQGTSYSIPPENMNLFICLAIQEEQAMLPNAPSLTELKQYVVVLSRFAGFSKGIEEKEAEEIKKNGWEMLKEWIKKLIDSLLNRSKQNEANHAPEWSELADELYGLYRNHPDLFQGNVASLEQLLCQCYGKGEAFPTPTPPPNTSLWSRMTSFNVFHYFSPKKSREQVTLWSTSLKTLTEELTQIKNAGLSRFKRGYFETRHQRNQDYQAYLAAYQETHAKIQAWSARALEQRTNVEKQLQAKENYLTQLSEMDKAFLHLHEDSLKLPDLWLNAMNVFIPNDATLQAANERLLVLHTETIVSLNSILWLEHVCYSRKNTEFNYFANEMEQYQRLLGKCLFVKYQVDETITVTDRLIECIEISLRHSRKLLLRIHQDKTSDSTCPDVIADFVVKQVNELRRRNQYALTLWTQCQCGGGLQAETNTQRAQLLLLLATPSSPASTDSHIECDIDDLKTAIPKGPDRIFEPSEPLGLFILQLSKAYRAHMADSKTTTLKKARGQTTLDKMIFPEERIHSGEPELRALWYIQTTAELSIPFFKKQKEAASKRNVILRAQLEQIEKETREAKAEAQELKAEVQEAKAEVQEAKAEAQEAKAKINRLIKKKITSFLSKQLELIRPNITKENFQSHEARWVDTLRSEDLLEDLSSEEISQFITASLQELSIDARVSECQWLMSRATEVPVTIMANRNGLFNQSASTKRTPEVPVTTAASSLQGIH